MNNQEQILKNSDRRSLYIDYLKKTKGASTKDFLKYLKKEYNVEISKGTISEDRKYLEQLGYKFTRKSGKYMLNYEPSDMKGFSQEKNDNDKSKINRDIFLDWMILYVLSQSNISFQSISNKNDRSDISELLPYNMRVSNIKVSNMNVSRRLSRLSKQGYLLSKRAFRMPAAYTINRYAPSIYHFSFSKLNDFCDSYKKIPDTGAFHSTIRPFFDFCNYLVSNQNVSSCHTHKPAPYISHLSEFGRRNSLPAAINHSLMQLSQLPFETWAINLCYLAPDQNQYSHILFSVGLIFYNTETDCCYLLGKTEHSPKVLYRLDRIIFSATTASTLPNNSYLLPEWFQIYEEMFSASLDEPSQVTISFDLFSKNIQRKLEMLCKCRKYSSLSYSDDKKTAIYTDTIRGLTSFAHFLRSFGRSAKVISPPELRNLMISSAQKLLTSYQEGSHEE